MADALQTPRQWAEREPGQGGGQLEVLTAGTPSGDSWVLMQSGVMDRMLEILAQRNDLVMLDTPPIPYVADAVALLRRVDGVIITASVSSTKGPEAAACAISWRLSTPASWESWPTADRQSAATPTPRSPCGRARFPVVAGRARTARCARAGRLLPRPRRRGCPELAAAAAEDVGRRADMIFASSHSDQFEQ